MGGVFFLGSELNFADEAAQYSGESTGLRTVGLICGLMPCASSEFQLTSTALFLLYLPALCEALGTGAWKCFCKW